MATELKTRRMAQDAAHVQEAIRGAGDYQHISVRTQRGHLVVYSSDDDLPVARLTPVGNGHYGVSFYRHTGRWEPMPFSGGLDEMADTIATILAPYLQRQDFSFRISRSDH
jgi:hypothetical protein